MDVRGISRPFCRANCSIDGQNDSLAKRQVRLPHPLAKLSNRDGRATYFGADAWSIHKGSCGLGYQHEGVYPGFHVLAPSDQSSPFAGSCGKCFEVKCRQEPYTDGYGNTFDNQDQCHNTTESLVVRAVDTCPCDYPSNAYSNRRWCCQDEGAGGMHADLSVWAFEKLGRKGPGSMAMSYREVCQDSEDSVLPALTCLTPTHLRSALDNSFV